MCRLIGEYISLELFDFVNFTSSYSLIPYMCLENSDVHITIGLINISACDLFQPMVGCWSLLVTIGLINMSTCDLFQPMVGCWRCVSVVLSTVRHLYVLGSSVKLVCTSKCPL